MWEAGDAQLQSDPVTTIGYETDDVDDDDDTENKAFYVNILADKHNEAIRKYHVLPIGKASPKQ